MQILLVLVLASFSGSFAHADSYQGLGKDSVSAETLKKFAAPAVESKLRKRIQNLLDVRAPGMGQVSLNGKELFFSWGVTGTSQVWKLTSPKGFPVQFTGGEDQTSISGLTPDGKTLVLSRDQNGEENPGIYTQPSIGGDMQKVFHEPKVRAGVQYMSDDSKTMIFGTNQEDPESIFLYSYDFSSKKIEKFFSEKGLWEVADFRKQDGKFLLAKWTGNRSSEYFLFDPKTKELKPVLGQNEKTMYTIQFGAKQGQFVVLTDKMDEFNRLYRFEDGKFVAITPPEKFEVQSFSVDENRKRILVALNDQGYTKVKAYDAKAFKELKLPALPIDADHIFWGSTTSNSKYTTVGIVTAKSPRVSYVLDWDNMKMTQWVVPSSPEVNTSRFARASLEFYPARDGTKIPMFVRRPEKCEGTCPVVVHFHGGPEGQSTPGFNTYAQMLVDQGFIFVEPNVRGSDGYGKTWLDSDNGPKRLSVITDIEDCARFIKKNWGVGSTAPKVGVMGWSYGGYSTLVAMTKFAGAFDAGVALVGMSNLSTFLMNTAPYRRILRISEYGDPEKDKDALRELSALTYLNQMKDPLLIIQGANDPRVPVGEAIQIHEAARDRKIDTQLIIFADEGHGAAKRENRMLEMGNTIGFFMKHLKR